MSITYLDCTSSDYIPDSKRKVSDKYFEVDPDFKESHLIDESHPYTIDDCALVRTTGAFPFSHEVHTPAYDKVYDFGSSMYLDRAIREKLKEENPDFSYEELLEAEKRYAVYYENPRETLHFTINGLVQSHMQGNFDGRSFIIVEPLKYHIDPSLKSLRPEDTFFKGNMSLSKESSLIISEEVYEQIKNNPKYSKELEEFNLFVYSGSNQALALRQTLNSLGYDSFMMSNHGFTNGTSESPALDMTNFLNELAREKNIPQGKHCYSDEYYEEQEKRVQRNTEIDTMHLKYILDNSSVSEEFSNRMLEAIEFSFGPSIYEMSKQLVDQVGLDEIARLTDEFNQSMIDPVNITYYEEAPIEELEPSKTR